MDEIDELSSKFSDMQNKNEFADVIKELFDKSKIFMISDLTGDEIKLITKIAMIGKIKNIAIYDDALEMYAQLVLSKNRMSRKEIIDAIKGYIGQTSLAGKMNPFNWNKNRV